MFNKILLFLKIELPDVSWITKKVNDELERAKAGKSTELDETYRQYVAQLRVYKKDILLCLHVTIFNSETK